MAGRRRPACERSPCDAGVGVRTCSRAFVYGGLVVGGGCCVYVYVQVKMDDFTRAIGEIKPAFGVSVDQLELCMPNGLLHYGTRFTRLFQTGLKFVSQVTHAHTHTCTHAYTHTHIHAHTRMPCTLYPIPAPPPPPSSAYTRNAETCVCVCGGGGGQVKESEKTPLLSVLLEGPPGLTPYSRLHLNPFSLLDLKSYVSNTPQCSTPNLNPIEVLFWWRRGEGRGRDRQSEGAGKEATETGAT
jgi:hypothetical protein